MYGHTNFDALKVAIEDVVKDPIYGLFFHHDDKHNHSFDENLFQFGAIYGCREMKEEGEKAGKKISASCLNPILTSTQFKECITEVAKGYTDIKPREIERRKQKRQIITC